MTDPEPSAENPGPSAVVKPPPETSEKESAEHRKVFEQLPTPTKELELLGDEAEKSTGPRAAALHKAIREKAG